MSEELISNWEQGIAYDLHTTKSTYLGKDEHGRDKYENKRTEMGELVYLLKYKYDESVIPSIINLLISIGGLEIMDCIVSIPPSNLHRTHQPVFSVARALGKELNIPVYCDCLSKKPTDELKTITDEAKRIEILKSSMNITSKYDFSNKNVLLFDDLYRSGSTLKVATELLYNNCNVKNIYVLTMTKTRSNR